MSALLTHGQGKTKLYGIYQRIKQRCYNPRDPFYKRYGQRGITVCNEWRNDFISFRQWAISEGYNDTLSLERINADGDYSPNNCRWKDKHHGQIKTRLYKIWQGIKQRCYNPKCPDYKRYGYRGVSICDEWLYDFRAFAKWAMSVGYNDTLTIDRKDVNGSYTPKNCRWITKGEQARNRRTNKKINGICLAELGYRLGGSRSLVGRRIKDGWDVAKAISTPRQIHNRMRTVAEMCGAVCTV